MQIKELILISESSEIFVDGCFTNEAGQLLMMSLYGRNGMVQNLMSRMQVPVSQGGLSSLTLQAGPAGSFRVLIPGADRLAKHSARMPKTHLVGELCQAWIYDEVLLKPDQANGSAYLVFPVEHSDQQVMDYAWAMTRVLSPLPLREHWKSAVIGSEAVRLTDLPSVGCIKAVKVQLATSFEDQIAQMVTDQALCLEAA